MKMHGLGNDFVVIDSRGRGAVMTPALARALGDRQPGRGLRPAGRDPRCRRTPISRLDFWNSDGTQAGACGNATRCVARSCDAGRGARRRHARHRARRACAPCAAADGLVCVNMGQPQLDWAEIPLAREVDTLHLPLPGDPVAVGMGNPHCVLLRAGCRGGGPGRAWAAASSMTRCFPQRTNVEFATLIVAPTGCGCGSGSGARASRSPAARGPVRRPWRRIGAG